MLYPSHTPLQARTIIRGRNTYHPPTQARKAGLALNCLFNGWGMYETDQARFAVDDHVFLVLNAGREYAFSIASETMVESLSICFPDEWLADAHVVNSRSCAELLDAPFISAQPGDFFETLYYHDHHLNIPIQHLRQRLDAGPSSALNAAQKRLLRCARARAANCCAASTEQKIIYTPTRNANCRWAKLRVKPHSRRTTFYALSAPILASRRTFI